jgi:hypothetical protein
MTLRNRAWFPTQYTGDYLCRPKRYCVRLEELLGYLGRRKKGRDDTPYKKQPLTVNWRKG